MMYFNFWIYTNDKKYMFVYNDITVYAAENREQAMRIYIQNIKDFELDSFLPSVDENNNHILLSVSKADVLTVEEYKD